jgi:hypothetical protein
VGGGSNHGTKARLVLVEVLLVAVVVQHVEERRLALRFGQPLAHVGVTRPPVEEAAEGRANVLMAAL